MLAGFQIGKESQVFEGVHVEILCFVDDKRHVAPCGQLLDGEIVQTIDGVAFG